MHFGVHVQYPIFFSDFNETSSSTDFQKKNHYFTNFMKIRPLGAKLFHADSQSDSHDEAKPTFLNFSNASKIKYVCMCVETCSVCARRGNFRNNKFVYFGKVKLLVGKHA